MLVMSAFFIIVGIILAIVAYTDDETDNHRNDELPEMHDDHVKRQLKN